MAMDSVGTKLGCLEVAGLLTICLDCFGFNQDGISLGKDFALLEGQLSALRIRLYAWGYACGFMRKGGYDKRLDHPACKQHVHKQLNNISLLFLDATKKVKKYELSDRYEHHATGPVGPNTLFINEGLQDFLVRMKTTKKKTGIFGRLNWALIYKKPFIELIRQLKECVEALELVSQNLDLFAEERQVIEHEIEFISDTATLQRMISADPRSSNSDIVSDAASRRILLLEGSSTNAKGVNESLEGTSTVPSGNGSGSATFFTAPSHPERPFNNQNLLDAVEERDDSEEARVIIDGSEPWWTLDQRTKNALQRLAIDTILSSLKLAPDSLPSNPFEGIYTLTSPYVHHHYGDDIVDLSRNAFAAKTGIDKPDRIIRATMAEMLTNIEWLERRQSASLSQLALNEQWSSGGGAAIQQLCIELDQRVDLGRHYFDAWKQLIEKPRDEDDWGCFSRDGDRIKFIPKDRNAAEALLYIGLFLVDTGFSGSPLPLQAKARSTYEIMYLSRTMPYMQRWPYRHDFLRGTSTPELEEQVTALMEIYMTQRLFRPLRYAAHKYLTITPTDDINLDLDEAEWGHAIAWLVERDRKWLVDNPGRLAIQKLDMPTYLVTLKRIRSEMKYTLKERYFTFRPVNIALEAGCNLRLSFEGPPYSAYRKGIFHLAFNSRCYPLNAPSIRFLTRIYHPNINAAGEICMDALKEKEAWSPFLTIRTLLLSIISLLSDPEINDPLVPEIAATYIKDRGLYERNAEAYTRKFAGVEQNLGEYAVSLAVSWSEADAGSHFRVRQLW